MNWDKVSIEQFAELQKTFKETPDNPIDKLNQKILQVSIITGKTLEEVEAMTMKDLEAINTLLKTPLPTKIHKRFHVNGVAYRFILNPNELTGGEYMSIMEAVKLDAFENLNQVLFNIARPIRRTLKGWVDYELPAHEIPDRVDDFKQMPISVANPLAVFFCKLSENLTKDLVDYSHQELQAMTKEMLKMENEMKRELQDLKDGDG